MKVYIMFLVFWTHYQNVNCAYKFEYINRDFSKTVKSLFAYLKQNLTDIGKTVKDFLFGKKKPKKMLRLDAQRQNVKASKDFSEYFVKNKWESGDVENDNPSFVNLKSESVVQLATPQLALWHGRHMESHVVVTKDGYFLTLHRIPASRFLRSRTILLHHGLLGSSSDWILLGTTKSLPYILADAGYDVWIANARGNYYSRGHATMTVDFPEYWNFSFQEMGQYDLPAVIDYIRVTKKTNQSIDFVGHSMGATALLVLLSTFPHYNKYLRVGVLLAPLAYMSHIDGPLKVMTSVSEDIIKTMGEGEFLPSRKVPNWLANKYCKGPNNFCSNPLLFLSGVPQERKWDASFIARLLYHVPAGGSINTVLHYIQLAKSGKFHKFNNESSEFKLNLISLPMALFSSSEDWLATVPDVLKLYFFIQNPIDHYIIRDRNVSHTDFLWGNEATILVYNKILEYLENGLSWNIMKTNEVKK